MNTAANAATLIGLSMIRIGNRGGNGSPVPFLGLAMLRAAVPRAILNSAPASDESSNVEVSHGAAQA